MYIFRCGIFQVTHPSASQENWLKNNLSPNKTYSITFSRSVIGLLMSWLLILPVHQQTWYWLDLFFFLRAYFLNNHSISTLMTEAEYSGFGGQYHAYWCTGSWSRQCIIRLVIGCVGQTTCIVSSDLISSTWAKQNPRYDSKCEYIFYNLLNNSACSELMQFWREFCSYSSHTEIITINVGHHGTCVTHVPWCMLGSLTCGDGENVPGIPGACACVSWPAILRIW